jgi:hypothetical protein
MEFLDYTKLLIDSFANNKVEDMLSTEIKEVIKFEGESMQWGGLLSKLINEGYLVKIPEKIKKIKGRPFSYYKLGATALNQKFNTMLILDQHGKHYPGVEEDKLDDYLKELLIQNPSIELSAYKLVRSAKASVSFDIK